MSSSFPPPSSSPDAKEEQFQPMVSPHSTPARRRTAHGQQTRQAILKAAVDLASINGLEGISIGQLATQLGMSKSGLFAHFDSKESLQLATLQMAMDIFSQEVIQPTLTAPVGMPRLQALCDAWLSYGERQIFRGGCFFAATVPEFDGRPGLVRDRLAKLMRHWLKFLARLIRDAQTIGHIRMEVDPEQLAFELHSLFWGTNWMYQLYGDTSAGIKAKTAIKERLQNVACETSVS